MIASVVYPRAAVIWNPSDGYNGKTIAFVFDDYRAEAQILPSDKLVLENPALNTLSYKNVMDLEQAIQAHGYNDERTSPHRLVHAAIKYFSGYAVEHFGLSLPATFHLQYQSTIPRSVGLAGSSAIIMATIKALLSLLKTQMDKEVLAQLVLEIETKELEISGGLQDRVAQAFEIPITMDFDKEVMARSGHGRYYPISAIAELNWYIAYPKDYSESSDRVHNDLRSRYDGGDVEVHKAMEQFASLTGQFEDALGLKDIPALNYLINKNYDLRQSIMEIDPKFQDLITVARDTGVSAKFTGSGGAIIGLYDNEAQFENLVQVMTLHQVHTFKPSIKL